MQEKRHNNVSRCRGMTHKWNNINAYSRDLNVLKILMNFYLFLKWKMGGGGLH